MRPAVKASPTKTETWVYDARWPQRCVGDWWRPLASTEKLPVLLIHGGGWRSLDRHSVASLAAVFQQLGHGVYNIDYRLIGKAPWPACSLDCRQAAKFLLEQTEAKQILVVGASAGGHLALLTGIGLTSQRCRAVLSLAGITRIRRSGEGSGQLMQEEALQEFFGGDHDKAMWSAASPVDQVSPTSPPIWLVHSRRDQVVFPHHSDWMAKVCLRQGVEVHQRWFEGADDGHGFWQPGAKSLQERMPVAAVDAAIGEFSRRTEMEREN